MNTSVSTADGDVRYVPEEEAADGNTFCSVAHVSRYLWARNTFELAGRSVLDFGCGSGYGSAILAETARAVLALDISKASVEFASSRYARANIRFQRANLETKDLPAVVTEKFDFIFSFDVIEHTEHYYDFIENITKLLAPGGTAVIGCPNRNETFSFNTRWNEYHMQEFTPSQLRWLLCLYFKDCQLYGQDFRERSVRDRYTVNTPHAARRKGLARLLWKWRRSLDKRLSKLRSGHAGQVPRISDGDMHFFRMMEDQVFQPEPFGLICICKSPYSARKMPQ